MSDETVNCCIYLVKMKLKSAGSGSSVSSTTSTDIHVTTAATWYTMTGKWLNKLKIALLRTLLRTLLWTLAVFLWLHVNQCPVSVSVVSMCGVMYQTPLDPHSTDTSILNSADLYDVFLVYFTQCEL